MPISQWETLHNISNGYKMATYQIPPPNSMDLKGDVVENWKDFESAWNFYCIATELDQKTDTAEGKKQVAATLCAVMGMECLKVMKSLPTLSAEDITNPDKILETLRGHFVPQRNVLFERYKFNTTVQLQETIDEYVVRMRQLAESCEFGQLTDSLIRDRLVIGTTDTACRDRLLRERPVPDLNRVIESLRASEVSKSHRLQLNQSTEAVNHVKSRKKSLQKPTGTRPGGRKEPRPDSSRKCKWCGKSNHARAECPAKDSECYKCHKKGHFSTVCLSRQPKVQEVTQSQSSDCNGSPFLGAIDSKPGDFWTVNMMVDNHNTTFKLDSGASATIVGDHNAWLKKYKLQECTKRFQGPGGVSLKNRILGMIPTAKLRVGGRELREDIIVLRGQRFNLLSKRACHMLELLSPASGVYNVKEQDPDFRSEYPELFKGLGCLKTTYNIRLTEDAKPVCLYTARRVPHPLLTEVEKELKSMVSQGVISPVDEPTEWCSGMVCVPKPNGHVRICVDLTALNKSVRREVHPMASVDENLAKIRGSKIFTKLDANCGFWQLPLDAESRLLTTFITPYGRFCFNRLPFGISSAPEIYQRTMSAILLGIEGVICHMDDVLIHGQTAAEHNERVRRVLTRLRDAGVTLNSKCAFSKRTITFLGHTVTPEGIRGDPEKVSAIRDFPAPNNVTELQRFNGMVNQFMKFVPGLATLNEPLRQLLRKDTVWRWDNPQANAFQQIKDKLISAETLAHYHPNRRTIIAADACQYGLGAVMMQIDDAGNRRPVCYASRSLTDAETRYAVIEKEALAATWACEKFSDYILGMRFTLESDHKPLIPLLSTTDLAKMPPRILRFRLRMMRYSPDVVHVQGKTQITADTLSRAPVGKPQACDQELINEVTDFSRAALKFLPATQARLEQIKATQDADMQCAEVKKYCQDGWPAYMSQQDVLLKPYWANRHHLTITDNLLMYDDRIVIPTSLQTQVLSQIHEGHLGITKCRARAMQSVWWPMLSTQIEELVRRCTICEKLRPETREPLLPSTLPERAWERIGSDLFQLDGKTFIIVVDYYSRWIEVRPLNPTTSQAAINALKSIMAHHGIPDVIVSDNGPQYASAEFKEFAKSYGFTHVTSSPRYPQSNGEVERAVQTAKNILKKSEDPYLGFLAYRTTPQRNGLSPSQLLMRRQLRSTLPTTTARLSKHHDTQTIQSGEAEYRTKMAQNYNKRHRATALPPLETGDQVWVRDQDRYGSVIEKEVSPRSYRVQTEAGGELIRNRKDLVQTEKSTTSPRKSTPELAATPSAPSTPVRRSGRIRHSPERLDL